MADDDSAFWMRRRQKHLAELEGTFSEGSTQMRRGFVTWALGRVCTTLEKSAAGYPSHVRQPLMKWAEALIATLGGGAESPDEQLPIEAEEFDEMLERFEDEQGGDFVGALEGLIDILLVSSQSISERGTAADAENCSNIAAALLSCAWASEDVEGDISAAEHLLEEITIQNRHISALRAAEPVGEGPVIGR